MPDEIREECDIAVLRLLDNHHRLPDALVAELRRYHGDAETRPGPIAEQLGACFTLMDHAEVLPDPLYAELYAYANRLEFAANPDWSYPVNAREESRERT